MKITQKILPSLFYGLTEKEFQQAKINSTRQRMQVFQEQKDSSSGIKRINESPPNTVFLLQTSPNKTIGADPQQDMLDRVVSEASGLAVYGKDYKKPRGNFANPYSHSAIYIKNSKGNITILDPTNQKTIIEDNIDSFLNRRYKVLGHDVNAYELGKASDTINENVLRMIMERNPRVSKQGLLRTLSTWTFKNSLSPDPNSTTCAEIVRGIASEAFPRVKPYPLALELSRSLNTVEPIRLINHAEAKLPEINFGNTFISRLGINTLKYIAHPLRINKSK